MAKLKYIDSEKLKAEIEKMKQNFIKEHPKDCSIELIKRYAGYRSYENVISLIESLQQEQKDILILNKKDWEKQEEFRKDKKFGIPLQQWQQSLPSNLDEVAKEYDEAESWSYEALPYPRIAAFKAGAEWMARQIKQEQQVLPGIEDPGIPGKDFIPVEWVDACEKYGKWKIVKQEQSEVDLENEVEEYFQGYWPGMETAEQCNTDMHFTPPAIMRLVKYAYELGFNARKEK